MIRKQIYVDAGASYQKVEIRNYSYEDIPALISLQKECFPPPFPEELLWNEKQLRSHVDVFQEGALCAVAAGRIIGSMTGLIVHFDPDHPRHKWEEATDHGYIRNHVSRGNSLYVVDISVSPSYRKLGIGKWLMQTMYELTVFKGLERLLGGGRIPHYHQSAESLSPEQYVQAVLDGKKRDPVLSFLLHCGRSPLCIIPDYLDDEESLGHAVLMEWKNPFYHDRQ
ncbi:GNAT family N-acetyltransferase [Bacillus sonorensis]|uniref:GNAT family N-acetyltransferase n=1 Tax=Bacillus sonorensis TaxID=119858 RepID=UPI0022813250|nr:GNAT family N-acetyltransferase [Bacillus sonorensis]MCY8032341.1 GNAT family N-acetyltransferase [Bacillus sonorensis]MCY8087027.1 GNAT family N-acetyltransferase [Bacillus sonorensis]MCY8564845.1 GNAT family N-acetyltransferase [Bacillus sonorensis]MCZ0069340.1 GNAT family N-acetyltransferase [Bacillus sonorensis]MCZ0096728.1 GNAT family N-acetyltransferase [Bacillus sonorensis]